MENKIKKAIATTLILGALAGNPAYSVQNSGQEIHQKPTHTLEQRSGKTKKPESPERKITLDFVNPANDFESNSKSAYSLNQAFGKISDNLGTKGNLDKTFLGRFGIFIFNQNMASISHNFSHELGHMREAMRYGPATWELDIRGYPDFIGNFPYSDFGYEFSKQSISPSESFRGKDILKTLHYTPTREQLLKDATAGLNQEEFNAYITNLNSLKKLSFDNGISFLLNKFGDVAYNAKTKNPGPDKEWGRYFSEIYSNPELYLEDNKNPNFSKALEGENRIQKYLHVLNMQGVDVGDIGLYLYLIGKPAMKVSQDYKTLGEIQTIPTQTLQLSQGELMTQQMIADVLSLQTWDSFRAIGHYLKTRERNIKPSRIKIGKTQLTPPLINNYLTQYGGFYNITSVINPDSEHPVEVSLATKPFTGPSNVDTFRLGGKYYNLSFGGRSLNAEQHLFKLNPFFYVNTGRFQGISAGTEIEKPLSNEMTLTGKIEYSKQDLLENEVKGKDEGLTVRLGVDYKF